MITMRTINNMASEENSLAFNFEYNTINSDVNR